jgi:hypothetical protein
VSGRNLNVCSTCSPKLIRDWPISDGANNETNDHPRHARIAEVEKIACERPLDVRDLLRSLRIVILEVNPATELGKVKVGGLTYHWSLEKQKHLSTA